MSKIACFAGAVGLLSGLIAAQSAPTSKFLDRAVIRQDGPEITVVANDSLPLLQAINALRLEYGWQVNWESAPGYSHFDLADDTAPRWRSGGWPSIRVKAVSRTKVSCRCFWHRFFAREG